MLSCPSCLPLPSLCHFSDWLWSSLTCCPWSTPSPATNQLISFSTRAHSHANALVLVSPSRLCCYPFCSVVLLLSFCLWVTAACLQHLIFSFAHSCKNNISLETILLLPLPILLSACLPIYINPPGLTYSPLIISYLDFGSSQSTTRIGCIYNKSRKTVSFVVFCDKSAKQKQTHFFPSC